jgi:hypothetical protein
MNWEMLAWIATGAVIGQTLVSVRLAFTIQRRIREAREQGIREGRIMQAVNPIREGELYQGLKPHEFWYVPRQKRSRTIKGEGIWHDESAGR